MSTSEVRAEDMRIVVDIVSAAGLGPGGSPLEVDLPVGSTVKDLLSILFELYGDSLRQRLVRQSDGQPFVTFIVNGERAEFGYELSHNDKLLIVPPIGGG